MDKFDLCIVSDDQCFQFDGEQFTPAKLPSKQFAATTVPASSLHTFSCHIPVEIDDEHMPIEVEIRFFEEGGLDRERSYAVTYARYPELTHQGDWYVEAFAIEESRLDALYKATLHANKNVIDLIAVPYFVYTPLYFLERLTSDKIDLFLCIGLDDAFAALYRNGRFLTFRQFPSITVMAKRWKIQPDTLKRILSSHGLDRAKYATNTLSFFEKLEDTFYDYLMRLSDMVGRKSGLFGSHGVDRVFVDFGGDDIPGLHRLMTKTGLGDVEYGTLAGMVDTPSDEAHRYVEGYYLGLASQGVLDDLPNLTLYERKPPFWRTHLGTLSMVAASWAVVLMIFVAYHKIQTAKIDDMLLASKATLQKLNTTIKEQESIHKNLLSDIENATKTKLTLQKKLKAWHQIGDMADSTYAKAIHRRKMMRDTIEALEHYALKATELRQIGAQRIEVEIITPYIERAKIAEFMNIIKSDGYRYVDTSKILLDGDMYKSRVVIE